MMFCSHRNNGTLHDANISNWFTLKLFSGHLQISQTEESLAKAINCVAQSNLSFTEENLRLLITELSSPLQTQMEQSVRIQIKMCMCVCVIFKGLAFLTRLLFLIQTTSSAQSNLTALFAELPAESFVSGNLVDVEFMRFWFQIKMKPLLPKMSREFLSCLATRSFSCQAYNALYVLHIPLSWYLKTVHYLINHQIIS